MKFLHTADWQIGMKAAHVGAAGEHVREARLEAAKSVLDVARARSVDFIVVAGDTFEDNSVDRVLVRKVVDILASAPCPVFVLPGNHDPLVPGSVFENSAWASAPNVTVLRTAAPLEVAGAVLLPCPLTGKHGAKDPTETIPREPVCLRVGIAHGSLLGMAANTEDDFPIPPDAPARRALDYLALGHWHSVFEVKDASRATRLAYSGTHETTKFGEPDSGNVLVVEIEAAGRPPRLEKVAIGRLQWLSIDREVVSAEDVDRLRREVETIADPGRTLAEVRLRGALAADALEATELIDEVLAARFLFARVDRSELLLAPADTRWIETLPAGPLQAVARKLSATGDAASREALVRLFALSREGGR